MRFDDFGQLLFACGFFVIEMIHIGVIEISKLLFLQQVIFADISNLIAGFFQGAKEVNFAPAFEHIMIFAHPMGVRITSAKQRATTGHAHRRIGKMILQIHAAAR